MTPQEFVDTVWQKRCSAILRTDSQDVAAKAMDAAIRGGFSIVEFTLTVPGVFELIEEFSAREGVIVGAGTVLRPADAVAAARAGAKFLVSPVVDEAVIKAARELGVAAMPGVHTATEMLRAHRAGAQLQKLFPAPAGGPAYVRACLGPMPFLHIVPTNGVDKSNLGDWFAAGIWGAGFVASLFEPAFMAEGNYGAIEARAREILAAAATVERGDPPAPHDPFAGR